MDAAPKVSPKQLVESLRNETESFLEAVMQTVNEAPDGEWIAGSEEQVRDLSAEFRERVPVMGQSLDRAIPPTVRSPNRPRRLAVS